MSDGSSGRSWFTSPRPARSFLVIAVTLVLAGFMLSGCSSSADVRTAGSYCVPLVAVEPTEARPGDTITILVDEGCDARTPDGGWIVVASHVGGEVQAEVSIDAALVDGFSVDLELPGSFPSGAAYAGFSNWDFAECPDNASCASPTSDFTVAR